MLGIYAEFVEQYMAVPVIQGEKTPDERFPGAVSTVAIEAMMQDRKALQAGTSHFLGQNFAKAQEIKFQDKDGDVSYAWTTSWGVSTRLIGALIMTHSDDDGLVLPPRLAPAHAVILPIYKNDAERDSILEYCNALKKDLQAVTYGGSNIRVELDDRDLRGGEKKWYHVKRGVPLRIEVGPKDLAKGAAFVANRVTGKSEGVARDELVASIADRLQTMQQTLFDRALAMREENTVRIDSEAKFRKYFSGSESFENACGFALCHFASESAVSELLSELKVTIRCLPFGQQETEGKCFFTGEPTRQLGVFAKAY